MKGKFRWIIVSLIAVITLINYIDRAAIGYADEAISKAIGINNAEWGMIGSAFSIGYLVLAFLGGFIVDRLGVKKTWSFSVIFWSIVTIMTALAGSFLSFFFIRILLGLTEGPAFPATSRAVSRWLPSQERGKALGLIVGVGVPFSLMIGGPVVTQLLGHFGYKSTFVILGAIGLVWSILWVRLFKDSPIGYKRVSEQEQSFIKSGLTKDEMEHHVNKIDWKNLLANRNLWITTGGYFAWGFIFWSFMYWLPSYLRQVYNLNIYTIGYFTILPWAVSTVTTIIGGFLADKFNVNKYGLKSRFRIMGVAMLLAGASLIPIISAPSVLGAVIFISLGVGFGFLTGSLWWVVAIEASPEQPGAASGFVDAGFAISGIVAPFIMGFVKQITGSFNGGFILMIIFALISAFSLLFLTKEREQNKKQSNNKVINIG
jgi:sugar phosphate permease